MEGAGQNERYDFDIIRPALVYDIKYDTPTGELKRNFWGVSATIEMSPGTWYAFYGRAGDGRGKLQTGSASAGSREAV